MTEAITLSGPAIINDLLRYPSECPITVEDHVAEHLRTNGLLVEDGNDGLDKKKPSELQKIAADEGVDLKGATTKDKIIDAINAHRASASA